jgi:UDP-sugar transporter A1/2/3
MNAPIPSCDPESLREQELTELVPLPSSPSHGPIRRTGSKESNDMLSYAKNTSNHGIIKKDEEKAELAKAQPSNANAGDGELTSTGLKVLIMLALQNCSKNLLTRYVLTDTPKFLYSAAVIGSELTKLTLSVLYILLVDRQSLQSIWRFLKQDIQNMKLLIIPASVYNLQQTLEYVALSNIDASVFSVLVQSKLIMTALFSTILLRKKLRKAQGISLLLLTIGVVLCNYKPPSPDATKEEITNATGSMSREVTGICATLGIALASGFAAVYTEKVIKKKRTGGADKQQFSLAYMQVQLASVSLMVMGGVAIFKDWEAISTDGLWHNFTGAAFLSVLNSGLGGLMVAAVLKYADSVLKGYATAISVILTGTLSWALFGTSLNVVYGLGILNVICAVLLYNARDLDRLLC